MQVCVCVSCLRSRLSLLWLPALFSQSCISRCLNELFNEPFIPPPNPCSLLSILHDAGAWMSCSRSHLFLLRIPALFFQSCMMQVHEWAVQGAIYSSSEFLPSSVNLARWRCMNELFKEPFIPPPNPCSLLSILHDVGVCMSYLKSHLSLLRIPALFCQSWMMQKYKWSPKDLRFYLTAM